MYLSLNLCSHGGQRRALDSGSCSYMQLWATDMELGTEPGPCWKQLLCLPAEPSLQPLWKRLFLSYLCECLPAWICRCLWRPVLEVGTVVTETSTNESSECSCIFGFLAEKHLSKPEGELHQDHLFCLVNQHCAKTETLHLHTVQGQKPFF